MSFGISSTSSILADPIGRFPLTFGFSFDKRRLGLLWYREDHPPWRYGRGVGIRCFGRFWFLGWSRRLVSVANQTDGTVRMLGGRQLLNDADDIGGWGRNGS